MLCYPFYRLPIKKPHALDIHLLPLTTSPWPFSVDMTVDHKVYVSHMGNVFWRIVHVYVCFLCVCVQSLVRYKAVMCLWSASYHQILQQSTFTDNFLCYFYKINNSALPDTKNALIFFLSCWTPVNKTCTFYFTHSLEQSHTLFARTLNGGWKCGLIVWMLFYEHEPCPLN